MSRIYLSPPHLSGQEAELIQDALESNWIAPLGPHVNRFEAEFASAVQVGQAAALSSGTAGLHLALLLVGVQPNDEVLCSDLTFAASAFAIRYVGAQPVFVDSDRASWNLDPQLFAEELEAMVRRGRRPAAALVVDLYGQCADWEPIQRACKRHEVPLIEDAAEALGATYRGRSAGGFGTLGVFSFNGNKILTTSGGGVLVSDDPSLIERARYLATQARDPAPHYEHSTIGYNYRLSNLLAAVGRAQLRVLGERVAARRAVFERYRDALAGLPGVSFMPEAAYGQSTRWLTCLTIDPQVFGASSREVRQVLENENIEARPVWKPMHLQPVFKGHRVVGGSVCEALFHTGLCLPSGSSLAQTDQARIIDIVAGCCPASA